MKKTIKELIVPAGMLAAMIIGAGIFTLPHVFYEAGMLTGFLYIGVFAIIFSVLHLMYAEVVQHTPTDHRLVGYARIYLGKPGEYASFFTTILGLTSTLLIYLVLAVSFMNVIHPFADSRIPLIIFWVIATLPILFKPSKAADLAFFITLGKIAIIFAIFFYGLKGFDYQLLGSVNVKNLLLPFSAVLFSLYGRAAISSIRNYFKEGGLNEKKLAPAIILGTAVSAFIYAIFPIGILGISGAGVSPDTISGLSIVPVIAIVTATLGLLSFLTSYMFLGLELREIFIEDLKFKKIFSYLIVIFVPIALYSLGLTNLLGLMNIAGGVFLGLEATIVILMWQHLKERSRLVRALSWLMIAIFLIGATYELSKLL